MRKFVLPLLFALLATSASASTVTATAGSSFTIDFNGIVDISGAARVQRGLSAQADFDFTSWSYNGGTNRTTVVFDITITNTSNPGVWQNAVVTAIGFGTNPNALRASTTGVFSKFVSGGRFPTGAGFNVEYCASGNRFNCNGPGNTPLNVGQSGVATVTMTFAGNISTLDFSNFGIRWQSLTSRELHLWGRSGIGTEVSTPPIPEPASMAVFALGALVVGAALRKRASA